MDNNPAWLLCDDIPKHRCILPTAVFTSKRAVLDYVKEHEIDIHGRMIIPINIDPDSVQSPLCFDDAIPLLDFLVGSDGNL